MDPEQTFLRVHARLSGMLSQLLTPRIRLALEYLYLAGAVALFCLLVVMHTNFVQQVSRARPRVFLVACLAFSIAPAAAAAASAAAAAASAAAAAASAAAAAASAAAAAA
jgi:hypothetical protein